jgi:biotin operon repressor
MMQFTAESLRTLKGAPLSILMAMILAKQPVSAQYLEAVTGYTDKPIQTGLRMLKEFGYITRNGRYNWQLASNIEQLPLMCNELDDPPSPGEEKIEESYPQVVDRGPGNIPCPDALVVSRDIKQVNCVNDQLTTRVDPEKFRSEKLALLDQYGILDPKRGKLARNPHITPRAIAYHCETAENTGLAIFRIEHGWRVPASYTPGLKDKPWQKYLVQEDY